MARTKSTIQTWGEYLGARALTSAIGAADVENNLRIASRLGSLLHRIDKRHRQRGEAHIRMAFPHWPESRVSETCEGSLQHLVQLAIEAIQVPREINEDNWPQRVVLHENLAPALEVLNAPGPCIVLTGHLGNFEVLGYSMAVIGYDINAIARPLDNPLLSKWLYGIREAKGMTIIDKFNATDKMTAVLRRGGLLGFTADQNAGPRGTFVPFFGKLASTYKSIPLLALRYKCPVLCGYAHRVGPGFRYEIGAVDMFGPDDWTDQPDPQYYIAARFNRAFETMIRRKPEQYFWMHRRWKARPRYEQEGKAMPASMRKKLESLPWMTQDEMDRLIANEGPAAK
ncbi:MAG: lysophospholipid acyltransferase family protein [Planctomycetota bacterium]